MVRSANWACCHTIPHIERQFPPVAYNACKVHKRKSFYNTNINRDKSLQNLLIAHNLHNLDTYGEINRTLNLNAQYFVFIFKLNFPSLNCVVCQS